VKLEGSLDAFSLADVLTLLQATGKSGALSLEHEGRTATVHLLDGQVAAAAGGPIGGLTLVRRLVAQGLVDEDAITDAAVAAAESGDGLVTCLLSAGTVDAEVVLDAAEALAVDTVFDLLRWEDGSFSFAADERPQDDVGLRAAVDALVEEASARMAGWDAATEAVPSPSAIPYAAVVDRDVQVSADEWALLVLVDGHRSVDDLVDLAGVGAFTVVTRLTALADQGIVAFRQAGDELPLQARLAVLELLDLAASQAFASGDDEAPTADLPTSAPTPPDVSTAPDVEVASTSPVALAVAETRETAAADAGGRTVVTVAEPSNGERVGSRTGAQALLGGPHVPGEVVPPRPEPFLPARQPEHRDGELSGLEHHALGVIGANATVSEVVADADAAIRSEPESADQAGDAQINRSMVLRLIAGVRGL
jgi:hypothetical protein